MSTGVPLSLKILLVATACSVSVVPAVEAARILAIETVPCKSHWNFMSSVLRALTDGGHNVTVFTPFPGGDRENYTEVDMSGDFPIKIADMSVAYVRDYFANPFKPISNLVMLNRFVCETLQKNGRLDATLRAGGFDAIVLEPGLVSGCATYVATGTHLPLIFSVPFPVASFADRNTVGDVHSPAAVSSTFADFAVPKTFGQRFTNTLVFLYANVVATFQEFVLKTVDPKPFDLNAPVPPSLVFSNGHFISDPSRPTAQNVVNVGGIHLKPPKKIPKVRTYPLT